MHTEPLPEALVSNTRFKCVLYFKMYVDGFMIDKIQIQYRVWFNSVVNFLPL